MTGFFIDLTNSRERALVASDTLAYSVDGPRHAPLGFATKVIGFPHLRGALIGSGLYDVHVRAAAALMLRPELLTFDEIVTALPGILRTETEVIAYQRGIADPDALLLFCAGWIGWNATERKFEFVVFENYKDSYAPQRGASGLIGIPNVPPAYVPPGFNNIVSPEVRAMAAMRAIRRFTEDHGEEFGTAPIGGEIVLTDIRPDGVSSRVVGRFDDFAATKDEVAETWADVGEGAFGGYGLVNKASGQAAAMDRMKELAASGAGPHLAPSEPAGGNRAERRRAEKMARKAGRRAA